MKRTIFGVGSGLLAVGLSALGATTRAQAGDPVSPQRQAQETELKRCEDAVAHIATTTDARFLAAWQGARVAFDLAEPESDASGDFAKRGLDLAERARALLPGRVEGHYYFAMCLGLYLRAHRASGITRQGELAVEGERAAQLDETFDHGGPLRFLSVLYAEAPRWVGPGDHDKAKERIARLMKIAGDEEGNKLAEARVWIALGEEDKARAALKRVAPERGADDAERASIRRDRDELLKKLD